MAFKTKAEVEAFVRQFKGKGHMFILIERHSKECPSQHAGQVCNCAPTFVLEDKTNDPGYQAMRQRQRDARAKSS